MGVRKVHLRNHTLLSPEPQQARPVAHPVLAQLLGVEAGKWFASKAAHDGADHGSLSDDAQTGREYNMRLAKRL